ncbi:GH25 family lysozyme M1 (1,4-beta-N-acetylmuramidase) [Saccharopolyspora lacisalsi]|uniref:GH25 family lysozyme M1 (1,4-beta-N-acetylmuramidase) n=1 Tax=Halosaccharopolyspora lacisalsi TaxID=1000566 RepID=A0A839DSH2_9PSEU|nr:GH25 family lysozyme [Halosaccharopolyspora lacisalsi]MBA8824942.1 GH25 family lysozyme M1 (1,4-beta-N-acetylmuramidase) [Halosaccharopolyspora lacisalsi]
MKRVQPAAQRLVLLVRRLWAWLVPYLRRFAREGLRLMRQARSNLEPALRRAWQWAATQLRRAQEWAAPYARRAQEWAAPYARRARERVAPYARRVQDRAAPHVQRARQWADPYLQRVQRKLGPPLAALRAKLPSIGAGQGSTRRMRLMQAGSAAAVFGLVAIVVGSVGSTDNTGKVDTAAHTQALAAKPVPGQDPADEPQPKARSGASQPKAGAFAPKADSDDHSERRAKQIGVNPTGIDVSNHNGNIQWNEVAASGQKFAFVLATDGTSFTNPMFNEQFNGAKQAGLVAGAYHFGRPTTSAVAQADRLMNTMGSSAKGESLAPVLDMEVSSSGDNCYGKSPKQLGAWTQRFLDRVKERTGQEGIIYSSTSFWSQCMGGTHAFDDNPLWMASYGVDNPDLFGGWDKYTFWQYTNKGHVPGISGYTDINRFQGTGEDLLELTE